MKCGDNWGLKFDLKLKGIPGPSMKKGLRFEKGGDLLRDAQDEGVEGGYLVKRDPGTDTWELAGKRDAGSGTYELRRDFGVWRTNTFKQLLSSEVRAADVTPMSEVFGTPNVVTSESSAGGLISHEFLGVVDRAMLLDHKSEYSDMVMTAHGVLTGISSTENYMNDDPFELVLNRQIRDEQRQFFGGR